MELFSVKRYIEGEQFTDDPNKEDDILQKLLKKAQARKSTQPSEIPQNISDIPVISEEHENKQTELQEDSQNDDEETNVTKKPKLSDEPAENEDFQVLGSNVFDRKPKVEMVLPPWLAHPTVIATSIVESSEQEDSFVSKADYLSDHLKESLKELSIDNLFPVQKSVIPWVLTAHSKPYPFRPRDICVSAPTGSGKTLAFAVPIVQLLENRVEKKIRALVVLPVAELALQVYKVFKKLTDKTNLSVCLLTKSNPFPLEQQKLVESYKGKFYSKADIVITTPGRLVEHLHATNGFCLKSLKFLVIDEADRIMNQVHHNWLYHLDNHVKTTSDMLLSGRTAPLCIHELESVACNQPHKMLFSATLSQDPEKLQGIRLFQPKLFTSVLTNLDELKEKFVEARTAEIREEFIGKYTTPAELTEKYCLTESRIKPLTLYSLITENNWTKFLCFTNSVESSGRLAFVLKYLFDKRMVIEELSGALNPKMRASVLSTFARGKTNGLICSDALARGIDIPDVDIVISYDPARHIKTYIHRIGRTARAGRPGTAITMLTQKELNSFNHTLSEVGKVITEEIKVTTDVEENNAQKYAKALSELRIKVEADKHTKNYLKHIAKEKAKPVDPSKMSLMEKLQHQAENKVMEKFEARQVDGKTTILERQKKKKPMKAFKKKQLNKIATKSHVIGKAKQKKN
ncbi:probable ATP-dependent RNA helicase Dbp73D [Episyrphus balteatus]|uniref:probable ATP-dependent RNA helicase Dbp73D n=1 Tax=Episyrphus balteatus TaxID=286459 RepID=UPI002485AABB|nr:probable ATP-dependent RNA helicase Dbp73D [Episyrphus balteatus]